MHGVLISNELRLPLLPKTARKRRYILNTRHLLAAFPVTAQRSSHVDNQCRSVVNTVTEYSSIVQRVVYDK